MPAPTHAPTKLRPETPHDRLVRQARSALRVARHFEGERDALARLEALGVDEAGDDVAVAPAGVEAAL